MVDSKDVNNCFIGMCRYRRWEVREKFKSLDDALAKISKRFWYGEPEKSGDDY